MAAPDALLVLADLVGDAAAIPITAEATATAKPAVDRNRLLTVLGG
jgi:hypothetical protein